MIKVSVTKNSIRIKGHADYSNKEDIVCASVSSIVYTTVNGILNINKEYIEFIDKEDMQINILIHDNIVDKLIENMITLLKELSKQYPKNIIVSKGE